MIKKDFKRLKFRLSASRKEARANPKHGSRLAVIRFANGLGLSVLQEFHDAAAWSGGSPKRAPKRGTFEVLLTGRLQSISEKDDRERRRRLFDELLKASAINKASMRDGIVGHISARELSRLIPVIETQPAPGFELARQAWAEVRARKTRYRNLKQAIAA